VELLCYFFTDACSVVARRRLMPLTWHGPWV